MEIHYEKIVLKKLIIKIIVTKLFMKIYYSYLNKF